METDQQNQQNSTNLEKIEANPYEQLAEEDRVIVDVRIVQGAKYRRIARMKNVKEQTVRTWFMEGGKFYEAYKWRKAFLVKEVEEENEDAKFQLQEGVADAITVLKTQVAKGNLRAAVELLKMAGFNIQKVITEADSEEANFIKDLVKKYERLSKHRDTNSRDPKTVQS